MNARAVIVILSPSAIQRCGSKGTRFPSSAVPRLDGRYFFSISRAEIFAKDIAEAAEKKIRKRFHGNRLHLRRKNIKINQIPIKPAGDLFQYAMIGDVDTNMITP